MNLCAPNYLKSQSLGLGSGSSFSYLYMTSSSKGYKSIFGISAHSFYNLDLTKSSGIRFELGYSPKGNQYMSESTQEYQMDGSIVSLSSIISVRTRLNYLSFRPLFMHRIELNEKSSFYACVGPFLSIGVNGQRKTNQRYYSSPQGSIPDVDLSNTEEIIFGSGGSGFDFIDFGISSVIGYTYSLFYTELSYDFGLNNIDSYDNAHYRLMNRSFSVKIGCLFQFKKNKRT